MKYESKFATVENLVTAICFGVGALLVVLALYTLMAVKTVHAENPLRFGVETANAGFVSTGPGADEPGTYSTVITN